MGEDDAIAEILAEWYEQRERGLAPDPADVMRAHPALADALRAHFAAQEAFDQVSAPRTEALATVGEFRLVREIGRGGMGVVYEAEQTSMGRRVALKVLHPTITTGRRAIERFRREAHAAGMLHHTNLVPVYAMGEERGVWFYAMELVEGRALDDLIGDLRRLGGEPRERTPRTRNSVFGTSSAARGHHEQVASVFAGVAEALEVAHQAGIVHRDVKPSNLILDQHGVLRITDFGLARVEGEGVTMTLTGDVVGTPAYMSPEQAAGAPDGIDARTDIYSLGATLYEVLTLHAPYRGASPAEICSKILDREPVPLRRFDPRIPRDLETIVQKAMEKDRSRRYQTAAEMARDLRLFAEGAAIRARRIGPLGRAWRRARRHKTIAAVSAVAVLLAIVTAILALDAARGAAERRELRYAHLLLAAEEAFAHGIVSETKSSAVVAPPEAFRARSLLSTAIEIAPERADAYLLRALCPGTAIERRLTDLDAARERGLGARTLHLARAYVFHLFGRSGEQADEARAAAALQVSDSPSDQYLRGQLALVQGQRQEAIELLSESLRGARAGGFRTQAHFARALARERQGDLGSAIEDLAALREAGDSHPTIRVRMASLWRRRGETARAETIFSELLADVRGKADADSWIELCRSSRSCWEQAWAERASEEACAAFGEHRVILLERAVILSAGGRHEEALTVLAKARTLGSDDVPSLVIRGRLLLETGKPDEALAVFDEALRRDPRAIEALWGRARVHEAAGRADDALAAYRAEVAAHPDSAIAHSDLGIFLVDRMGDAPAGEEEFRAALRLEPDFAEAHYNLGNALSGKKDGDGAAAAWRDAIRLKPTWAQPHNNLAWLLLARGATDDAVTEYREAIRLRPDYALAHYNLGVALAAKGDREGAVASYREAIRLDPERGTAHVNLGRLLEEAGDADGALQAYRDAIRVDDRLATAHSNLGNLLRQRREYAEAETELRKAVALDDRFGDAWFNLGMTLHAKGDSAGAVEAYLRALALDDDAETWNELGIAHLAMGDAKRAIEAYRNGIARDPGLPRLRFNLARALCFVVHDYGSALDEVDRYLAAEDNADGWNIRGSALWNLQRLDEAIAAFERASALAPEDPIYHLNKGDLLLSMRRDWRNAVPALEKAVTLASGKRKPYEAYAHQRFGVALWYAGRTDDALRAMERAIEVAPDDAWNRIHRWEILAATGRHEEALAAADADAARLGGVCWLAWRKALTLRLLGRDAEARAFAAKSMERSPDAHDELDFACLCTLAERPDDARRWLAKGEFLKGADNDFDRARIHAALGDRERALERLVAAAENGCRRPVRWVPEPSFESLASDPRFHAAMKKILVP